jgi:hypothetical protein
MIEIEAEFERATALIGRIQTYCAMTKRHVGDPTYSGMEKIEELCLSLRISIANIKKAVNPPC